jgi:hypothetical protein
VLGLLDASLGDLASAETRLREAHALAVARRHAPWVAQIGWELAKVLRAARREDEARSLGEESLRIARELGMTGLVKNAGGVEEPRAAGVTIERSGATWRVVRGAIAVTVKDSRGMQLLARLVERPDEEIHVLALASDEGAPAPESSAGEMLDDRARTAYRARLAEIDAELEDAERTGGADHDTRVAKHRGEKEAILAELARAVGLGGRARQAGSSTERARVNVQRRVKDAIARIGEADAALGGYFERAVRTGTFCCFRP